MKRFHWWLRQLRPNAGESFGRTRKFEFLETRFCYSADGISTNLLLDPIVDFVEVATQVTLGDETRVDQRTDETRDEEELIQYYDEVGPVYGVNPCIEIDESLDHTTVCDFASTIISDVGPQTDLTSKVASNLQGDVLEETAGPAMSGASGPTALVSAPVGPTGLGPQLHPVENLNIGPVGVSTSPSQHPVVFRETLGIAPSKLNTTQNLKSNEAVTLGQSPFASEFPSISFKQSNHKPTASQLAVSLRPQVSAIPSIMPMPFKVEARSVETKLKPQIALDPSPVSNIETSENRIVDKAIGRSDPPPIEKLVSDKSNKAETNQKPLLVGAIVAGWIARPRRALGRLVGNMQARFIAKSICLFLRDKSLSNRPIVLEEADE